MKKLILAASLLALGAQAKAALFLNNNTNCSVIVQVYAHDLNHGTCGLLSGRIVVAPMSAVSFNNVTNLNTTPGWLGQTAVTTGGTTVWGWDGITFNGSGGGPIGNTTACFTTDNLTVPNGCIPVANVTATWTAVSSSTAVVDFN
ncbi:hypothetical protein [Taibaiella koreensis]|uniref:hypothetical protein n=1 Tax=Taibaiella koreensis TaxID=1268548 RepID=UPI000E5A0435|nr:hypothetical protein [Taibaiella koreensis]